MYAELLTVSKYIIYTSTCTCILRRKGIARTHWSIEIDIINPHTERLVRTQPLPFQKELLTGHMKYQSEKCYCYLYRFFTERVKL